VWPSWGYSPESLRRYEHDPAALRKALNEHITDIVSANKGRIHTWDVLNEPVANDDFMRVLGEAEMARWFEMAHRSDPQASLFLNDYAGFGANGENTAHKDAFERIARSLKEQKAPIHGIGIQSHFGWGLTAPDKLVAELDRWAKLGLDIHITEFDVNISDEKLQAGYMRDFYTTVFSHPAVSSITMWGFWEGRHWLPDAAIFRKDWSVKPAGQALMDLLRKEWWTRETGQTSTSGEFATLAYFGEYSVTVTKGDITKTFPLRFTNESAMLKVKL
jgi:GH35 family endo-1,4-beta-xylanase